MKEVIKLGLFSSQPGVFPHGSSECDRPLGEGKAIERRKRLVVEKIMEGKEAGK